MPTATAPSSFAQFPVTNPTYGGLTRARVLLQTRPGNDWGWAIVEPIDGRYYVTDTGQTLHLDPRCGMLWCSVNVIKDKTRTLAYRVMTRGSRARVKNGVGGTVSQVCERCGPKLERI